MTTNAIAIARELVTKGGADEKLANAIAEVMVMQVDESSATKAELAKVEAKVDAERQARADRESTTKEDVAEIKLRLNKIENRLTRLETSDKWNKGLLIAILLLLVRDVIVNS